MATTADSRRDFQRSQRSCDFAELDSMSSALNLGISPADKIYQAVFTHFGQITGLIKAVGRIGTVGISQEHFAGFFRILVIPGTEPDALNIQVSGLTRLNGLSAARQALTGPHRHRAYRWE